MRNEEKPVMIAPKKSIGIIVIVKIRQCKI